MNVGLIIKFVCDIKGVTLFPLIVGQEIINWL